LRLHFSFVISIFSLFISIFAHEMITPEEYKQLKAFARQDGALLSLMWIAAFICYLQGLTNPLLGMIALILITVSPFYAASRLRHFRDQAREGVITFLRAYAYTVFTFFYAGLLFAIVLFIYFNFIDQGFLLGKFAELMSNEENRKMLESSGMADQISQGLSELQAMRPIDHALNMLTVNIMTGFVLGLPIAAFMQRSIVPQAPNSKL